MREYSVERLRGTVTEDGLLWHWGVALRAGYAPGRRGGGGARVSLAYASRVPCPDYVVDLSRAFAALRPDLRGLDEVPWRAAVVERAQFNRWQAVIWLFYVESLGNLAARQALARQSVEARDNYLAIVQAHPGVLLFDDDEGDARVARQIARLRGPGHISRSRAAALRSEAITQMAAYLGRGR